MLVDVRDPGDFESFRIPGSVNIPIYALKTKNFLKSKKVILVNEGWGYNRLQQECFSLLSNGFKDVKILNGGLNSWKASGETIQGDVFAQRNLDRMSPEVFHEEKQIEDLIVVDVSEEDLLARDLIPRDAVIPFSGDKKNWGSILAAELKSRKNRALNSVLIFNTNGDRYEEIEKQLQGPGIGSVFFLE